jgi:hypothetical protein
MRRAVSLAVHSGALPLWLARLILLWLGGVPPMRVNLRRRGEWATRRKGELTRRSVGLICPLW